MSIWSAQAELEKKPTSNDRPALNAADASFSAFQLRFVICVYLLDARQTGGTGHASH